MSKKRVLFLCTHNSARSQMAEALLRHCCGHRYESFSAGTQPSKLNPYVVRTMEEMGIDMSMHSSKGIDQFIGQEWDYIVTVCDNAKEACPYIPGAKEYIHESFSDPSGLIGSDKEIMSRVRLIKKEIQNWLDKTFDK
jgi:arsenate reductase (thioredoxin)